MTGHDANPRVVPNASAWQGSAWAGDAARGEISHGAVGQGTDAGPRGVAQPRTARIFRADLGPPIHAS